MLLRDVRPLLRAQLDALHSGDFTIMAVKKRISLSVRLIAAASTPSHPAGGSDDLEEVVRQGEGTVVAADAMGGGGRTIWVRRHLATETAGRKRIALRRRRKLHVTRKGSRVALPGLSLRGSRKIRIMTEGGEMLLGTVTITSSTLLAEVRKLIKSHVRRRAVGSRASGEKEAEDPRVQGAFSALPDAFDFLMPTDDDAFTPIEIGREINLRADPLFPEIRVRESGAAPLESVRLVASGVEIGTVKVALDVSLEATRRVVKRQLWDIPEQVRDLSYQRYISCESF